MTAGFGESSFGTSAFGDATTTSPVEVYLTVDQLVLRLRIDPATLTDDDRAYLESVIAGAVTRLAAALRISGCTLTAAWARDPDLVREVLIEAVARTQRAIDAAGIDSESEGNYSYKVNRDEAGANIRFLDADIAMLCPKARRYGTYRLGLLSREIRPARL